MMIEAGIRQRVLITAGAVGIGRAIAEAFVDQGAEVWVIDVDEASLATCPADWHRSCLDVTDEAAVLALFKELHRTWDGLDVQCANAGIAGPIAPVEELRQVPIDSDPSSWRPAELVRRAHALAATGALPRLALALLPAAGAPPAPGLVAAMRARVHADVGMSEDQGIGPRMSLTKLGPPTAPPGNILTISTPSSSAFEISDGKGPMGQGP